MSERRGGTPRTEEERKEEHKRKYGGGELPLRGTGLGLKGKKRKMGEEKKMRGDEVSDACLAALRAASEVIGEKCKFTPPGIKKTVEIEGIKIEVPSEEVENLKGKYHALMHEEKVAKMEEESEWLRNMSTGWIRKVLPFYELGTPEFEKARKAFAHSVAEGIVAKYAA